MLLPLPIQDGDFLRSNKSLTLCPLPGSRDLGKTLQSRWLRLDWMSGLGLRFKLWNSTALQCEAQGTPEQQVIYQLSST